VKTFTGNPPFPLGCPRMKRKREVEEEEKEHKKEKETKVEHKEEKKKAEKKADHNEQKQKKPEEKANHNEQKQKKAKKKAERKEEEKKVEQKQAEKMAKRKKKERSREIKSTFFSEEYVKKHQAHQPKPGQNLRSTHPKLAEEWDYKANGYLRPEHVSAGSSLKVTWICKNTCKGSKDCKHQWPAIIQHRTSKHHRPSGCPHCTSGSSCRPCCLQRSAASLPVLVAQFDPKKNEGKSLRDYSKFSGAIMTWSCPETCKAEEGQKACVHDWPAQISHRALGGKCPFCTHETPNPCCAQTSLANPIYASVLAQWDYIKNVKRPEDYWPTTTQRAHFLCRKTCAGQKDCKHESLVMISSKTGKRQTGCKFCISKGERPCCQERSLAGSLHRHLLEEWATELNDKSPRDFYPLSNKYAFWKCKQNSSHKPWKTAICNRTGQGKTGCPRCRDSHMERDMSQVLTQLEGVKNQAPGGIEWWISNVCREYPMKINNRTYEGDFSFILWTKRGSETRGMRCVVEVDGIQHFLPVAFSKSQDPEEALMNYQRRDQIKNEFCATHQYPLLRICFNVDHAQYQNIVTKFCSDLASGDGGLFSGIENGTKFYSQ